MDMLMSISENMFVEFCMANRERLLKITNKVSEKYSEGEAKSKKQYQEKTLDMLSELILRILNEITIN